MVGFKATWINEMIKLSKKKKLLVAAILSIIAIIIGQVAVTGVKYSFGLRIVGSGEFPLIVLSIFSYTILPLFAIFVAIDMFNSEFTANTMKMTLTRPVSRFGVFSAKIATIGMFIITNLVFVFVLSLLVGLLFNPSSVSFVGILKIILAYGVSFLPVFVFSLLVVFLSNIIRGGLAVFFLSVIIFIGLTFLGAVFSRYSGFFITSLFDWHILWISENVNILKIIRQLFILLGSGTMFFTAGYYLFERRDI